MHEHRTQSHPKTFRIANIQRIFAFLSESHAMQFVTNCGRCDVSDSEFHYANIVQKMFIVAHPFVMFAATGSLLGQCM